MSDYLTKDYEGFRSEMLSLIPKKLPEWTDQSSSDAGIVLLELFAHGLDILSYYQDRAVNEVYLPTATELQSVVDICKLINYKLTGAIPSQATLIFKVTKSDTETTVIPKGFQVSTQPSEDEEAIVFETDAELIIPSGNTGAEIDTNGNYLYSITATQGMTIYNQIIGSSTGEVNQKFRLAYANVISGSVDVYVDDGTGFTLWTDVTNELVQLTSDGKQYWCETDSEGYSWIIFGAGPDGKVPPKGIDNIQATYRVGGGSHTNVGTGTITRLINPLSRMSEVTNIEAATGGADAESIEEARRNAPISLRTSERAVTKSDYKNIAFKVPGVMKAYAERDSVNNYLVHLYIVILDGFDKEKVLSAVYDYIDERKMITTELEVKEGEEELLDIDLTATIGDTYSRATIETYITEVIQTEMSPSNREFGEGETIFQIYPAIGQIEGIVNLFINKFTTIPQVKSHTVSGNATWSGIDIKSTNTLRGSWKVTMTSATDYKVEYDSTGEFDGSEVSKGTGTLGTLFTSNGGEISFTITAGSTAMQTNDYWTFKTQPYKDDILIEGNEILTYGKITITVTGGVS
jgi:uncharacterized phage protein gp47/JayE